MSTEIQLSHQSTQVRERKRKKRERGDFSLEMLGYEIGDEFGLLDFTAEYCGILRFMTKDRWWSVGAQKLIFDIRKLVGFWEMNIVTSGNLFPVFVSPHYSPIISLKVPPGLNTREIQEYEDGKTSLISVGIRLLLYSDQGPSRRHFCPARTMATNVLTPIQPSTTLYEYRLQWKLYDDMSPISVLPSNMI